MIAAVLGWLAWRRRDAFVIYRNALLISGVVGMVIVGTFPVAPPRLMDLGLLDTVTLHSEAYRVLQPPSFTNQYAAMPSFHVGWDLLAGLALVREGGRSWTRVVGSVLPLLMVLSVYLGLFNLFPVLPLDGGHIVLAGLDRVIPGRSRTVMLYLSIAISATVAVLLFTSDRYRGLGLFALLPILAQVQMLNARRPADRSPPGTAR